MCGMWYVCVLSCVWYSVLCMLYMCVVDVGVACVPWCVMCVVCGVCVCVCKSRRRLGSAPV